MTSQATGFRSQLGKVRGLGSAKRGAGLWITERITALALIPLTVWFVVCVVRIVSGSDEMRLQIIASPINTILLLLFTLTSLYHGFLGMKVIIEDYMHKESAKVIITILLQFITIITAVAFVCAILLFHLSLFSTTM